MSANDDALLGPWRRLLQGICPPDAVRAAETSNSLPPLWDAVVESGFLDALLPEDQGGAGLRLGDVYLLVAAEGEFALPVPFAETMMARALIGAQGSCQPPPDAAIVLAPPSTVLPLAGVATHALVQRDRKLVLLTLKAGAADPFRAGGGVVDPGADAVLAVPAGDIDLLRVAAGLVAAKMAGAMIRLLDMSVRYANERQQFGRPLGKFQAIQHQLAVMAEQVASAVVAARIGMSGECFHDLRVAVAKARTSEAAQQVCAIAHAVHGAIGVTEEYDLQLYTRRLKQWQLAFGTESFWAKRLGEARLAAPPGTSVDFVRLNLQEEE